MRGKFIEKTWPYAGLPLEWIVLETSMNRGKDKMPWVSKDDIPKGL